MVTLEAVRQKAEPSTFPRHVLDGCETGLVLYAAGFYGCQDAIWLEEAGVTATCVDIDHVKLGQMVLAYPEGWEYVHGDVFYYAALTERVWDVVTVDCPTDQFDRCSLAADLWCSLSERTVVLGSGAVLKINLPDGWEITERLHRSDYRGGTYWTVIQCS